ncbi:NeuD/PglB/VioB family sugar acetyltransferase [Arthrobacter sp. GMC3]|uniref:NeuD/PglB/VioB family sugar acetyltransferase n=1 Tax=Arthrobacter sp. GMC3 TaxID=2058894 RepID=UPI000CE4454B|nr:NeuD/PglB/VioB family sugar acetyltransferase [Arthrobacter sp. GMC3]
MDEVMLVAASGLAREVLASLRSSGAHQVIGFLDDDPALAGTIIDGVRVLGGIPDVVDHPNARVLICAGKGAVREVIASRLGLLGVRSERYATVIDRTAIVSVGTTVGAGSVLLSNVVLTAGVRVGSHVVLMPNVTLTHDDELADFATLTAGVSLGGSVHVGKAAYLGMNSSVREGRTVGAGATVGMGAAVVTDVPDGQTWVGVPARPIVAHHTEELVKELGRIV